MSEFVSVGIRLSFSDEGEGRPVVLVHGFASNRIMNWVNTSWITTLARSGRRVIALDNRGHGQSQKLYEPASYTPAIMAADVLALIDHLGLPAAALLGYSMGARIAAFAALSAPEKITALVLSGLADTLVKGLPNGEGIAAAFEAPSAAEVADPDVRGFRVFAEETGSDLTALAACIRATRQTLSEADVARIAVPTLVVAGANDTIAGSADALAALIPGAKAVTLAGRDHMSSVGDRIHKSEVLAFLDSHGA